MKREEIINKLSNMERERLYFALDETGHPHNEILKGLDDDILKNLLEIAENKRVCVKCGRVVDPGEIKKDDSGEYCDSCQGQIIIVLKGGLIQNIAGIPPGLQLIVKDYDTKGADQDELSTDSNGDKYFKRVWEAE